VIGNIIGICGRKRSGKDTAALALKSLGFKSTSFARPLKTACRDIYGLSGREVDGDLKERAIDLRCVVDRERVLECAEVYARDIYSLDPSWNPHVMTTWGKTAQDITRIFVEGCLAIYDAGETSPRRIMQTVGTDICRNQIHDSTWLLRAASSINASMCRRHVITDVRFENEAAFIRSFGGVILRVDRPSLGEQTDLTESEVAWQSIQPDYCALNDSTIEAFSELVRQVANDILIDQA
jgi:hypothetical protein